MRASKELKESMDDSADPCNDFYTFACGGFNAKAVIPDDKISHTTFDVVGDRMEEQVGNIHSKRAKICGFHFSVSKNLRKKCVNRDDKISRQKCINQSKVIRNASFENKMSK